MPQVRRPHQAGIRFRPGAPARGQARRPLRARDQEEAEAAQVPCRADGRVHGSRQDGQPATRWWGKVPETTREVSRPRVVIAGAGFAGLTCARGLKGAPVDVLLVDRNNYHLFTPLLYQVASSVLDPGEIARPVRELIRPLGNVEFRQTEIHGADLQRRLLLTDHGPISYDYLVLATGAQTDYFGNASLE